MIDSPVKKITAGAAAAQGLSRSIHSMIVTARSSAVLTKVEARNLLVESLHEACGARLLGFIGQRAGAKSCQLESAD